MINVPNTTLPLSKEIGLIVSLGSVVVVFCFFSLFFVFVCVCVCWGGGGGTYKLSGVHLFPGASLICTKEARGFWR